MTSPLPPWTQEIPWIAPRNAFAPFASEPGAILLESARQMPTFGRYSFIAIDPFIWREWSRHSSEEVWTFLREQQMHYVLATVPDLPPFQGGLAGTLSYEMAHTLENLPRTAEDPIQFPDAMIGVYDLVVAFDHDRHRAWICSSGYPLQELSARHTRAQARMAWLATQLATSPAEVVRSTDPLIPCEAITSAFTRERYLASIAQVVEYIRAGDIFEANISQRWYADWPRHLAPFDLYQRLCHWNAAPFAAFIQGEDTTLVSASPERFVRLKGREVDTCPIKGTRRRGSTPEEDLIAATALQNSEKDRAENVMIVDLMRNDLSRICAPHSVQVPKLCMLESFETVHHLVSTVTGRLLPGKNAVDLLSVTFPGGSITGAPKIRAMEIISEIEQTARGPYCGTIGYIGFDGSMDTSIVIRTFSLHKGRMTYQAGGAIVCDSIPEEEYQETLDKAAALLRALTDMYAP